MVGARPRRAWRLLALAALVLSAVAPACAGGDDASDPQSRPFVGGPIVAPDLSQALGPATPSDALGDDELQGAFATSCEEGDLRACDDLYQRGAPATSYADYAFTCGGRLTPPPAEGVAPNCRLRGDRHVPVAGGAAPTGGSPSLARLAETCGAVGGTEACDTLYRLAGPGNDYADYAITCGYRNPDTRPNACAGYDGIPGGRPPTGVGGDPELDVLAQECFRARLSSCDELYASSDRGTSYETYAQTCGGRLVELVERVPPSCDLRFNDPVPAEVVPSPGALGDSERLDALADGCAGGTMRDCDELFYRSDLSTDYENWGATCGGRFAAQRRNLQFSAAGECDARVVTVTPGATD